MFLFDSRFATSIPSWVRWYDLTVLGDGGSIPVQLNPGLGGASFEFWFKAGSGCIVVSCCVGSCTAELDAVSISAGKTFGPAEVDFLKAEWSTE